MRRGYVNRIGPRRALGLLPQANVVELGRLSRKTSRNVAQALTVCQLREGRRTVLIGACHRLYVAIAAVTIGSMRWKVFQGRKSMLGILRQSWLSAVLPHV